MPDPVPASTVPSAPATALPASLRHGYGVGAFAIAVANTAMMFFLLKYLVDSAGLSPAWAGSVLMIGKGWDAFADPVVGWLSDRTVTTMGSRRPWVLGGTVPFALAFVGTFWGLPWTGVGALVGYTVLLLVYNAAYSAVVIPYGALTPALTADYDERTKLNGARMGWSMIGGIVAGVAMPMLAHAYSWRTAALVLGCLVIPPLFLVVWATRGRDISTPVPVGQGRAPSMWTVLNNRPYRRIVAQFCASWTVVSALGSLVPFYVEHHLHRTDLLDALFAAIQISALIFVPVIVYASKRMQKHTAYAVAMVLWAVVLTALALVPVGDATSAIAIACLVGPGVAAAHVLPWAMLPDVVEIDRLQGGVDRTGQFYGMMTFLEKVVLALTLWGVGLTLQAAGYVEGAASQPESARIAILCMLGPIPGVILLFAGIGAVLYPPLTREEHARAQARPNPA